MALNQKELFALAKATAKASLNPSTSFSFGDKELKYDALNQVFRQEMNHLAGDWKSYRKNKDLIFSLIEVGIDEVLPVRVLEQYGQFADVKTYAQGDKPVFNVRISEASKRRAKGFVTRVGLAGRYETFKLDGYSFEVNTTAYGGAARIEFEEFLDGRIQMSDLYDIVLEGLDERVYLEIAEGLVAMTEGVKAVNKTQQTSFNEQQMDRLLATAGAYGKPTVYCTFEFAATMKPASAEWASNDMKNTLWNNGYPTTYKGHNVIVLPQSFTDTTNEEKVIDPSIAFIIPTGSEKPVKIAFEGDTAVREVVDNDDWSRDIQTYKKVGIAVYNTNPGICVYQNTSLTKENK